MSKQINNNKKILPQKNATDNKIFNKKLSNATKIIDASNENRDDDPHIKILNDRIGRIEELVDSLAKTTRGLASKSKREDRYSQIDLTLCSLQQLQKLVGETTNIVTSNAKK